MIGVKKVIVICSPVGGLPLSENQRSLMDRAIKALDGQIGGTVYVLTSLNPAAFEFGKLLLGSLGQTSRSPTGTSSLGGSGSVAFSLDFILDSVDAIRVEAKNLVLIAHGGTADELARHYSRREIRLFNEGEAAVIDLEHKTSLLVGYAQPPN